MGADGEVYAVAQGQVAVAGFSAAGNAETVVKGVPTSGRIANGAIIERELEFELEQLRSVKLALRNPDLTTARRIAQAINGFTGETSARSLDPTTVQIDLPARYHGNAVALMTDIEPPRACPPHPARAANRTT